MTTYRFFPDHIQMVESNSKGYYYYDSTEDLTFILTNLRVDFFTLISQTTTKSRACYIKCYNVLLDIKFICQTLNPDARYVISLVRNILSFLTQRSFKNFRIIIKD